MEIGVRGMTNGVRGMENSIRGMTKGVRGMTKGVRGMTKGVRGMTKGVRGMTKGVRGMENGVCGKEFRVRGKEIAVCTSDGGGDEPALALGALQYDFKSSDVGQMARLGEAFPSVGCKSELMPRERSILLAADDETTIRLIRDAYGQSHLSWPLMVARNGSDAVHYLRQRGIFVDTVQFPPPRLVVADLEMAALGGLLIVRFVRKLKDLGEVPVVVFGKPMDIMNFERASELGANERLFKPETPLGAEFFVSRIEERWLNESAQQKEAEERG